MSEKLSICLIGTWRVSFGGTDIRIANRKTSAILACLALSETPQLSRERLLGMLWSEADSDRARASLRQALHELREGVVSAGFEGFETDKLQVGLMPGSFVTDVGEVMQAAERGEAHPLALTQSSLTEELLRPLESVDPAFEAWVSGKRRFIEDTLTRAYEKALASAATPAPHRETLARALAGLDPTNEIAVRQHMITRFERGDVAGALHAYKNLWDLLSEEFDTEPSRMTQDLFVQIKMAEESGAASGPTDAGLSDNAVAKARPVAFRNALAERLVISVAPFDVDGVPHDRQYLVHGFRRDLLSSLVRFREWLVREASAPAQAASSHDEYAIEASAFAESDGLRLALMLKDNASGVYLWSERFRVSVERWAETQQSIVRRIAAVLNVQISSGRLAQLADRGSEDATAYDRWLKAQVETFSWNPVPWTAALAAMRTLARERPGFSPAFSSVTQMLNSSQFVLIGKIPDAAHVAEAIDHGLEATRLDPVDTRGHLALGWAYAMGGQHDRAVVHHDLAVELNDNDPWTLMSGGLGAACRLRHDIALARAERAMELSISPGPMQLLYWANIAFLRGDYATCVSIDPAVWRNRTYSGGWFVAALGQLGRHKQAKLAFEDFAGRIRNGWLNGPVPDDAAIGCWFLKLWPFINEAEWAKLRDGFANAGVDVSAARFSLGRE